MSLRRTCPPSVQCLGEHSLDGRQVHEHSIRRFRRSLQEIRDAIPPELFVRDTRRGLMFLTRDILLATALFVAGTCIDSMFEPVAGSSKEHAVVMTIARWTAWGA